MSSNISHWNSEYRLGHILCVLNLFLPRIACQKANKNTFFILIFCIVCYKVIIERSMKTLKNLQIIYDAIISRLWKIMKCQFYCYLYLKRWMTLRFTENVRNRISIELFLKNVCINKNNNILTLGKFFVFLQNIISYIITNYLNMRLFLGKRMKVKINGLLKNIFSLNVLSFVLHNLNFLY